MSNSWFDLLVKSGAKVRRIGTDFSPLMGRINMHLSYKNVKIIGLFNQVQSG